MYNKVEICGINTSTLKLLSDKEKYDLLKKAKAGDYKAREELIKGNLKLVLSVIRSFSARGECADDLFQVGCIGLIKAVDRFDLSPGVKFSTYAYPLILGEVRRFLRDGCRKIRTPRSMKDLAYRALKVKEKLSAENSEEPSCEKIARELKCDEKDVVQALASVCDPVSLFDPVYTENGDSVYVLDQIKDEKNTDEKWLDEIAVRESLEKLCERERRIIELRFFFDKTQTEVSEEIGISQAQVSRLEKSALDKIKRDF